MVMVVQFMEKDRIPGMIQFDEVLERPGLFLPKCFYIVYSDGLQVDGP